MLIAVSVRWKPVHASCICHVSLALSFSLRSRFFPFNPLLGIQMLFDIHFERRTQTKSSGKKRIENKLCARKRVRVFSQHHRNQQWDLLSHQNLFAFDAYCRSVCRSMFEGEQTANWFPFEYILVRLYTSVFSIFSVSKVICSHKQITVECKTFDILLNSQNQFWIRLHKLFDETQIENGLKTIEKSNNFHFSHFESKLSNHIHPESHQSNRIAPLY